MEHFTPLERIPFRGNNQCLLRHSHDEHDWYYTSEMGGHMIDERNAPTSKHPAKHHCMGLYVAQEQSEYYLG